MTLKEYNELEEFLLTALKTGMQLVISDDLRLEFIRRYGSDSSVLDMKQVHEVRDLSDDCQDLFRQFKIDMGKLRGKLSETPLDPTVDLGYHWNMTETEQALINDMEASQVLLRDGRKVLYVPAMSDEESSTPGGIDSKLLVTISDEEEENYEGFLQDTGQEDILFDTLKWHENTLSALVTCGFVTQKQLDSVQKFTRKKR